MAVLCSTDSAHGRRITGVVFLLTLLAHHGCSLTFHYDSINSTNKADFGALGEDCSIGDHRVDLTNDGSKNYTNNRGRLLYPKPVQLWDNNTGETASFTTTFSFGIDAIPGGLPVGHGMAFFLTANVDNPSNMAEDSGDGYLGLFSRSALASRGNATGGDRVVAVEFDAFMDGWDPSDRHIGVDVNNINSYGAYTALPNDSFVGRVMSARIDYDDDTRRLDVVLHNGSSDGATYNLSATVDLRSLLPEQVTVGFSAATSADRVARHYVLSWSFSSTLEVKNTPSPSSPRQGSDHSDNGAGSPARSGVMSVLLSCVVVVTLFHVSAW